MSSVVHPVDTEHGTAADSALDDVDSLLIRMFALVSNGLAAATEAFLDGDRVAARAVVASDPHVDELQLRIEERVERRLTEGGPASPIEVRLLISMLRIAPELERSGDLIEHIALRTPQRLTDGLTARACGLLADMGATASMLWAGAGAAYADRDPTRVDQLRLLDDALDDLHVRFTAELAKGQSSIPEAIELGLIARFYERLGDHAVNVARRIRYLTDG